MRTAALFLAAAAFACGAVEGTVKNGTNGKPQAGALVTLMKLGQGMDSVGTAKTDAEGRFRFEHDKAADVPYLVQASHAGVNYSKMLQPGAPSTGIALEVFDASSQPGQARVIQHMILLEPSDSDLTVSESIIYENSGKTTWQNTNGTFRFYLPPEASGNVRISATSQGGMPLNRTAEKTSESNIFTVAFAVKPGETRFDLSYALPAAKTFASRLVHGGGPLRIVAPRGVSLKGEKLDNLGPEPRTQATVYEVKSADFKVEIEGTGTLRAGAEGQQQEDTGPSIDQSKPRIYNRLGWVLGLTFAIFGLGFLLLYRVAGSRR